MTSIDITTSSNGSPTEPLSSPPDTPTKPDEVDPETGTDPDDIPIDNPSG